MRSPKSFLLSTATASLAVLAAGAGHAQGTFNYLTTVNPFLLTGNGAVLITGAAGYDLTAPTTGLTLANFNVAGNGASLNAPFTIDLTVNAPYNAFDPQTKPVDALLTGSFTSDGYLNLHTTSNSTSVTSLPSGVVFNFGKTGTYTFSNFQYTPLVGNPVLVNSDGRLTADVSYAAATPEPSSVAAFAFTGLGVAGMALKARKRRLAA